eukprot:scaffold11678_cov58-Phaeocystis_antarctica.AAC.3
MSQTTARAGRRIGGTSQARRILPSSECQARLARLPHRRPAAAVRLVAARPSPRGASARGATCAHGGDDTSCPFRVAGGRETTNTNRF